MRCPRCAQLIAEISYECPYCHEVLSFENVVEKNGPKRNKTHEDIQDNRLTYLFTFIPLGGLLYFLFNREVYPLKSACAFKGFVYNSIILALVIIVLLLTL